MRRCLRTSIPLSQCYRPIPSRQIHLTSRAQANSNFTDDVSETDVNDDDSVCAQVNSTRDEFAYAREVNLRSMRRWEESQDPKGKVKFLTMGREFTIPYGISEMSNMSLNHLRELRSYYRKIMYEMPQFKRTSPPLFPFPFFLVLFGCMDLLCRIPATVSSAYEI
jgi:hypothetical protein